MRLEQLIASLIAAGYTPEEAAKVAAATLRAQSGNVGLANSRPDPNFPASPQSDGRRAVDYGDETPEEAKERWLRQELNDPAGLYSGGAESGGVFGVGPIALDNYDPSAFRRTLEIQNQTLQARTQMETLRVLQQMQAQMRGLPSSAPRRDLGDGRGHRRLLGKKRR